ncbi:MAG: biotin biosynthesis cytochrome P450 [Steroidobacteraceae bacterium]
MRNSSKAAAIDDPLADLNAANRYVIYQELRERMPVYWSTVHSSWVITRYGDVSGILRHPESLALEVMPFLRELSRRGDLDLSHLMRFCGSLSLLTRPPRHDAVRGALAQALGGVRRLNLHEMLDERADRLLDEGERLGSIDLAENYGRALSLFAIATFLGIPEEDLPRLTEPASVFVTLFEYTPPSVRTLTQLDRCAAELSAYFTTLLATRRQSPGTDGLSLLLRSADERFGPDDAEFAENCSFLFSEAMEATATAISSAALMLMQRPAARAQLYATPSLLPAAVQEMLRLASPIQFVGRQMRSDVEIAGQRIPAGAPVLLMLGAANRDSAAFPDPDTPMFDRAGPKPLTFALGPYTCAGAQLASLEIEIALRKLLDRPRLQLAPSPPVWSSRRNIAPLQQLPACFT